MATTSKQARRAVSTKPESTTGQAVAAAAGEAQGRVEHVQQLAERALLVQLGAGLVARDSLVSSVKDISNRYRTRAGLERELERYERRGATARTRLERRMQHTRSRIERELHQRRSGIERTVRENRARFEREVRSVRRDVEKQSERVGAQVGRLVGNAVSTS
jgi:hypothetical protein